MHAHVARFRTADDAVTDRRMEQFNVIATADGKPLRRRAVDDLLDRVGEYGAVIAGESFERTVGVGAKISQRVAMAFRQRGERMITGFERFQRGKRGLQPFDQLSRRIELLRLQRLARIAAMQVVAIGAKACQRMRQPVAAGLGPRAAQHGALEHGNGLAMRTCRRAEPQQGMLEQRQQRDRLQPVERRLGGQPRKASGLRLGQRIAAGIVGRDMPAFQCRHDAARQSAIRRHQSRGLARRIERFAQDDRDGERFFFRIGGLDHTDFCQGLVGRWPECGVSALGLPAVGGRGRAQGFRDQPFAAMRRWRGEVGNVAPRNADRGQQGLHGELRVTGRGNAVVRFVASDAGDGTPGVVVEVLVEARKHHGAMRQRGDGRQQLGGCRHRTGGTGGDHRRGAARQTPGFGFD